MAREETCLDGGGECGARLRAVDWSQNSLGPPQAWPRALQTATRIVLASAFPMRLHWGPELITLYNDAFAPTLGARHPAALAQPARENRPGLWDRLEPMLEALAAGRSFSAQDEPHGFGPESRADVFFSHSHSPLRDDDGQVAGIFVVVVETTRCVNAERDLVEAHAALELQVESLEARVFEAVAERRVAEDQLRQAQKLEAVGQLTGGVAHDFNNLLTIIRSSVDFLRRRDLPEERRRRYIDAISDTVDRAAKLTGQLLAFARRQPLKPEVFDVGERVRAVVELVRPLVGARVRIELEIPETRCCACADVSQFETALVNLAVNARDAMDGAGLIVMSVRPADALPSIRGHLRRQGAFVAVTLRDTGSGVDPEHLETIFQPFYTTKEVGKGTGLGLSQVFGFAKQSEGEIAVTSELGRGSAFTLYLPRVDETPLVEPPQPAPHAFNPRRESACILVVEDNEAVGRFSTEMLQDLGYRTAWAANGREALDMIAERPDYFDLVFTDVVMPGMNGVELAQRVRQRHPGLPVVLTSGYSHILAEEGRHGFELVQKPYSVEVLSHVLRKAVGERGTARLDDASDRADPT